MTIRTKEPRFKRGQLYATWRAGYDTTVSIEIRSVRPGAAANTVSVDYFATDSTPREVAQLGIETVGPAEIRLLFPG